MPKPKFTELMESAFAPLVDVSGLQAVLDKLKTADLPPDLKSEQMQRMGQLQYKAADLLLLSSSKFVFRFSCCGHGYVAFSVEDLSRDEIDNTIDFMIQEGLSLWRLEECFFLFIRHNVGNFYKLKREYRNADAARDFVDVLVSGYIGHQIWDVIACYEDLLVFQLPENSVYNERSIWYVAARLASGVAHYRSPILGSSLSAKIGSLVEVDHIPEDNIYTALTAIHWKYVFFELYRCLEKLFYLPWHYALKQDIAYQLSAASLAKLCRARIDWRATEAKSIQGLFELLEDEVFGSDLRQCLSFNDLNAEPLAKSSFGRRVYKIRNILVHQQDYDDPSPLDIDESSWVALSDFMSDLLSFLYKNYAHEIVE